MHTPKHAAQQRFSSVWDAIENTPQQAASMRARSELMMNLTEVIRQRWKPHGPALVLLNVIAHNPGAVIEALAA